MPAARRFFIFRRSSWRRRFAVALAACSAAALCATLTGATTAAAQPAAQHTKHTKPASTSLPVHAVRPLAAGDEIVDGRGDSDGWHLYAASSGNGWAWQPLATLAPAGVDANGERWTGRQCLTGDGRYVVAVVAPWNTDNSPDGADRGGIAYVVDAHSGAVRPLLSGVSLYYFSPSCGAGDTVALTRFAGTDEQTTQVVLADPATATVRSVRTLAGQFTGAVPDATGGFYAASGADVVHVPGSGATTRSATAGAPFDLVADASGGVAFLVGAHHNAATVWESDRNGTRQVGGGVFGDVALFAGKAGHPVAEGTTNLAPTAGITALTGTPSTVEATSLAGTAFSLAPTTKAAAPSSVSSGSLPRTPLVLATGNGKQRHVATWQPTAVAPRTATFPSVLQNNGTIVGPAARVTKPTSKPTSKATARVSTADSTSFTSDCAVARNDVNLQAMQPSPEDVDWAANLAGRSLLTGGAARSAGYANLGLPAYSPSQDFPLPAPFGPNGDSIPREVLEGIFAQESNFNQASWHSVQGVAGNPLIADYYGAGGGDVVGVQNPDCGYGLGQVTTGMHVGDMSYDLQRKVAVDYAENVAAAAQILAQKWNELADAGITANDADPSTIENWYLAIWDYNSGLHADTGSGPWGLGWANNPANPDYPYNRGPFLHADTADGPEITYDDAATPGNWPYQEKVFGWMEVPIESSLSGNASYQGTIETYDPSSNTNVIRDDESELARPGMDDFCTVAANECDPTICSQSLYGSNCDPSTSDGTGPCTRSDFECWWHFPDSWCSALNPCHTGTWEYAAGSQEPPAVSPDYDPLPTCSVSASDIPAGTDIVDSQADAVNLQGCDSANENWHNSGSFAFTYGDPAVPDSQQTDIDVHQLGTGLGGHIWFTHTDEPTDDNGVSLWGVTGTWTPGIPMGRYQVKVFVPGAAATATEADYTVHNGLGLQHTVTINQDDFTDQWVSLGYFWLGPGSSVSLTNLHVTSDGDLAFSGMAFVPADPGEYAMLGDSYSAGEGAGNYDMDTNNFMGQCLNPVSEEMVPCTNNGHRTSLSYNRDFAADTTTFGKITDPTSTDPAKNWVDVACSGATIEDFYDTDEVGLCPNEPGQLAALNDNTSLVTMTFGGNDLGFAPVVQACIVPPRKCMSKYDAQIRAEAQNLMDPTNEDGWPHLIQTIQSLAPNAEIVLLGYPHLVPGSTVSGSSCLADGFMAGSDRDWLNSMGDLIDQDEAQVASDYGIDYLSTTATFAGHELCTANSYFTGILDPNPSDTEAGEETFVSDMAPAGKQEWFHPNASGYLAESELLLSSLQVP